MARDTVAVIFSNLHASDTPAIFKYQGMEFTIVINAPKEKVWRTLWDDTTYREWTSVFAPGSLAKTDWQKGSKALFVNADNSGMVSVIEDVRINEFMSIKHLGIVKNGVEDLSPNVWTGAMENYTLKEINGTTELLVHMDSAKISKQMLDYFNSVWPEALDCLKQLAESA